MSLKVCVLGSGSSGNSIFVMSDHSRVLIDAGMSAKQVALRLGLLGVEPESIDGICVSHEHIDHVQGIRVLQKRHGIKAFANRGTWDGMKKVHKSDEISINVFQTGSAFNIGDIQIESFSVPHDAYEPVGFKLSTAETSVGVVTDLGLATSLVRQKLSGCHALVIEANHDEDLLREAPRPWSLKQRIRGRQGHLSNTAAARLIADCATDALEHVFLAHLSSDCNTPDIAIRTIASQLRLEKLDHINLEISLANKITNIWQPRALVRPN